MGSLGRSWQRIKEDFYISFDIDQTSKTTMSLHWSLIAGFLYVEIGVMFLFLIPFISNKRWSQLFKSRFLKAVENQLVYYFYIVVAILVLFFLDAIREMSKYSENQLKTEASHGSHLDTQMQTHMRLFRSQRNFYISGFALFLCLVIKRLVSLITSSAIIEVEREAALKQALSASRAAESLMQDDKGASDLEKKLEEKEAELQTALADVTSMKAQSLSLTKEYDRLMEEKDKVELRLRVLDTTGGDGDKKDD